MTDELGLLQAVLAQPPEATGVIAQRHPELGVGSELQDRSLDALCLEVVARDRIAAEEERGAIHDVAEIGTEVVRRQAERF